MPQGGFNLTTFSLSLFFQSTGFRCLDIPVLWAWCVLERKSLSCWSQIISKQEVNVVIKSRKEVKFSIARKDAHFPMRPGLQNSNWIRPQCLIRLHQNLHIPGTVQKEKKKILPEMEESQVKIKPWATGSHISI